MLRKALIVIALSVSLPAEAQLPSPPPAVAPQVVKDSAPEWQLLGERKISKNWTAFYKDPATPTDILT